MTQQSGQEAERRAMRRRLFADRDFTRLDGRVQHLSDFDRSPVLRDYLYSTNAEILELDGTHPMRGRAAFVPGAAFLHLNSPTVTLRWNRTENSVDRAVILLVRQGRVEVTSEGPIRHRETAHLIGPHHSPAMIRVLEQGSELMILSIPARYVHTVIPDYETAAKTISEPLPSTLLAPIYGFVSGLCALSLNEVGDASPLLSAAEQMMLATLRIVISTREEGTPSLYGAAVRIILHEYADPSLDIGEIARRLQVSTRTLQTTFKAENATVSSMLRAVRGAAATKIQNEQPRLTKSRVAKLVGFGSVDALNRALRSTG